MTDQDANLIIQTKIKRARRKSAEITKKTTKSILRKFAVLSSPLTLLLAVKLYRDYCDDPDHPHFRQKRDAVLTLHPDGANLKSVPNDDEVIYDFFDLESQKETLLSTLVKTGEDIGTIEDVMKEANNVVTKSKTKKQNTKNQKVTRRSDTKVFLNATVKEVFKGNFPSAYWLHTSLKYNSRRPFRSGESIFKVIHKGKTLESLVLTDTGLTYITRAPKEGRNQRVLLGSQILTKIDDDKLHYLTLRVDEKLLEVFIDCQRISRHETLQSRHSVSKNAKLEAFIGKDAQLQLGSISIMNSKIAKLAGVCCDNAPSDCECLVHPKKVKLDKRKKAKVPPRVSRAQNLADLGIMKLPCEVSTIIGEKGKAGKNGKKGKTGKRGKRGEKGLQGKPGKRGPKGPPGICPAFRAGPQGMKGHRGKTGPVGKPGPVGKQGWPGEAGKKGEVGIRGLIGPTGPPGRRGRPGSQGELGVPGPPGEMGQIGRQGEPGEAGSPGKPGARGPARRMPDLDKIIHQALQEELPKYIRQLKKQCSRSCASMLSRQTHSKRGKSGPPGEVGPRGFKGEKGNIGHGGERGYPGLMGPQGAMGVPGEQGWPGEQGEVGETVVGPPGGRGRPGPQGPRGEGIPGEAGEKGDKGDRGPMGGVGPAGIPGEQGVCDNKECLAPSSWASQLANWAGSYRKGPYDDGKGPAAPGPRAPDELGGPSLPGNPTHTQPGRRLPAETIRGDLLNIPQGVIPHLKGPDGQRHTINLDEWARQNFGMSADEWRESYSADPNSPEGLRSAHNVGARRRRKP